mmetsp:Transcript_60904/g.149841  ORF Transcript_60904/g.149841 Transcript_60904/m.149841 type:complete len:167 (-) Transcript_60904:99-599(-)
MGLCIALCAQFGAVLGIATSTLFSAAAGLGYKLSIDKKAGQARAAPPVMDIDAPESLNLGSSSLAFDVAAFSLVFNVLQFLLVVYFYTQSRAIRKSAKTSERRLTRTIRQEQNKSKIAQEQASIAQQQALAMMMKTYPTHITRNSCKTAELRELTLTSGDSDYETE